MYSKNDYRYYREHRLMHSEDFLAHYGVKGMKWRKHKQSSYDPNSQTWTHNTVYTNDLGKGIVIGRIDRPYTGETGIAITRVNRNKKAKTNPTYNKIGRISSTNLGNAKTTYIDTTTKKKRKKAARRVASKIIGAGAQLSRAAGEWGVLDGYLSVMKKRSARNKFVNRGGSNV